MNINVRAAIRTVAVLGSVCLGVGLVYLFAILGMLPGVMILCALVGVFILYDINKTVIEYEDKLDQMVKKNEKKVL